MLDATVLEVFIAAIRMNEKKTPLGVGPLHSARRGIAGSVIGGIKETQEMLDFCSKHNIACDIELTPIQKVNEAYERVVKSDVRYRFVIDIINSLKCKDQLVSS